MAGLCAVAALAFTGAVPGSAAAAELRGGLDAIVAGQLEQDPKLAQLAGLAPGELAYFAVLTEPNDASHADALAFLGARVLRSYRSFSAFALASPAASVGTVADVPWVRWLAPVDVVRVLADTVPDQSRGTTGDLGASAFWNAGITGAGTRIAVLDTGLDTTHPDLDDLDFRRWSNPLPQPAKVIGVRSFLNGGCTDAPAADLHGHGTHVAGIALGTGEGAPGLQTDDGRYPGIAPDAQLAVGTVMKPDGSGVNSDLLAALEWAAMPAGTGPAGCESVGAEVVNLSLGSESRPARLNSGDDVDLVSYVADRLAVRYGTIFVGAIGNSGPFIGSGLESPGSASQVLSVAAAAKDYDVNHDDTQSGDNCSGWQPTRAECAAGSGGQPASLGSFSSRGPAGDLWLRPDVAAPGYNIVSAQAISGAAMAQNDLNAGTRADPFYATASGTSMAAPATAGGVALLLQAYRIAHGASASPQGASGVTGVAARTFALVRAALMNTARSDLYESRWMLTTGDAELDCAPLVGVDVFGICSIFNSFAGSMILYEVRNGAADPYVGPLAEGAGKIDLARATSALVNGVVAYSTASGAGEAAGTGPRDLQGTWQIGAVRAGADASQRFVLHAAPGRGPFTATFSFVPGNPSDGSRAIPTGKGGWRIDLPGRASLARGGDALVNFKARLPAGASPGSYTGVVRVTISNGQTLHIPVFASVALHDGKRGAGTSGSQASVSSARDVFGKADTSWPFQGAGTGAGSDWLVYPVELASGLSSAVFSVYGVAPGDDTYDLYVYDAGLDLVGSTHPFHSVQPGTTNALANLGRGPTTATAPQTLSLTAPAAGRYYVAVNRAKLGASGAGSTSSFTLSLDER